jgi:hypothetical protein
MLSSPLSPSPPAEKTRRTASLDSEAGFSHPTAIIEGRVASLLLDDAARRQPHERHIRPRIQQPAQLRKPPRYRSCLSNPNSRLYPNGCCSNNPLPPSPPAEKATAHGLTHKEVADFAAMALPLATQEKTGATLSSSCCPLSCTIRAPVAGGSLASTTGAASKENSVDQSPQTGAGRSAFSR